MPITTPRRPDRPILWIVAGPNGSGKSTLYDRTDIEGWGGSVWIINPDLLTAKIVEHERLPVQDANLAAVERIETWLDASIDSYQTIGVETVLSSPKYQRLVGRAHDRGFEVRMLYVVLGSAELQLERICHRVREGGHDVPADKVLVRRARSFEQLAWFAREVDQCLVFDNSSGEPELIAQRVKAGLFCWRELPDDMYASLAAAGLKLTQDIADLDG